jgi:hypothetical protein
VAGGFFLDGGEGAGGAGGGGKDGEGGEGYAGEVVGYALEKELVPTRWEERTGGERVLIVG